MRHLLAIVSSLFLLIGATASQASAQSTAEMNATLDTLFGAHKPYQAFFEKLKAAVSSDDKATVASMIEYPFRARIDGKAVTIKDANHFVADYDQIITSTVKNAVRRQTYPTLFANWQGVSVGNGEIWFSGIGDTNTIKITAIND